MSEPPGRRRATRQGLILAAGLLIGWLGSLLGLLALNLPTLPGWALVLCILIRAQLQTGLFIIGHDAMHQVLWPGRARANALLGTVALVLYAGLPYGRCCQNHSLHHEFAATGRDPDFPSPARPGVVSWYGQFMAGYLTIAQMCRLLAFWAGLAVMFAAVTPTALLNVLLFCTVPLLLSSLQLFVFGTYLPHRHQRQPASRSHPDSLNLPAWLSLLACFHFGYHREHHDNPDLAWFELPGVRVCHRLLRQSGIPSPLLSIGDGS